MNAAYLIQFAVSAVAVALMVGLAAWATRGRGSPRLDEPAARSWLADEFPGRAIDGLWLAVDGTGALAKSGDRALVLSKMGDGYVARQAPWERVAATRAANGRLRIDLPDVAAPRVELVLGAWPPKGLAA